MKNKYGWSFIGEPFNENFFRTTNSFLEIGDDVDKLKLVDFEDISELKGIFSRPINKDTPDFNRVWEYLGKPKPDYLQIVIDTLYKLRHCMRENDWPSANAFYGALNNVEFREMVKIFRDQLLRHQHELISRYFFKELAYQKDSMLVIAVIKDYVHYNPSITYNQLENIFPRSLQGQECFNLCNEELIPNGSLKNKFIRLKKSVISVNEEWGINNISSFIDHCNTTLSSGITRSN